MFERESSTEPIHLIPIDKDTDVLSGYERKELIPTDENPLLTKYSTTEAFNSSSTDKAKEILTTTLKEAQAKEPVFKRWNNFVAKCKETFHTRASDFRTSEIMVLFSKRVNDRLAEFEADFEEGEILRNMQENENHLKEQIKQRMKTLTQLAARNESDKMITLVENTCMFLTNYDSPNFYPAQFILVSELIDHFSDLVHENIMRYKSDPKNFENNKEITREIIAIDWAAKISTTRRLLPKLLMEIAFLKSVHLHPFKTKEQQIEIISKAIGGLCSIASIFIIDYLIKTVFFIDPKNNILFMSPLLAMYAQDLQYMKKVFNKVFYPQLNFSFDMFLGTQEPALRFFLKTLISLCDGQTLADVIDSFYKTGKPDGFIMKVLLEVLPSRFVSIVYSVLMKMIDESDDAVSKHILMHHMIDVLADANEPQDIIKTTNDLWTRAREYECDDFIYVAVPLSRYVCKFCPPSHINSFFVHLLDIVDENYAKRTDEDGNKLSEITVKSITEIVRHAVSNGRNFGDVLDQIDSIVDLMDYLDGNGLVEIALFILDDIREKPFEMSDPLCVRVLLEQCVIAFQSISILSPDDVVEKIIGKIEWFLYRVDFGTSIEAHLSFLLQARESFQTSSRLSSVVTRIALRDCIIAFTNKIPRATIALYSLFAFALATIPSITDQTERAWLFLFSANIALECTIVTFSFTFFDWFMKEAPELPATPKVLSMLRHAYSLMLVMPSRPEGDVFEVFRNLIKISVRKKWTEDIKMQFAVDAIVIGSHMQRSNYILYVEDVDSNNVLYRNCQEFYDKIRRVMDQMATRLNQSIMISGHKRGLIKNIATVPIIALRAIAAFADCYQFDEGLKKEIEYLVNSLPRPGFGQMQIEEVAALRDSVELHLTKIYASNKDALEFIERVFR